MKKATKPVLKCFTRDVTRRFLKRKSVFWATSGIHGHADKRKTTRGRSLPVVGFVVQKRVNKPDYAPNQRDRLYIRLEAVLALERL